MPLTKETKPTPTSSYENWLEINVIINKFDKCFLWILVVS